MPATVAALKHGIGRLSDTDTTAAAAVRDAISELENFFLVLNDNIDAGFHETYVDQHRAEYERTVRDVLKHRPLSDSPIKVLEIGAFFGVVCIALASLGYDVTSADLMVELAMERFRRNGTHDSASRRRASGWRTSSCRLTMTNSTWSLCAKF